MIKIKMKR